MQNISQYDSGERCSSWASCLVYLVYLFVFCFLLFLFFCVTPTQQPGKKTQKTKQALWNIVVFACCMDMKPKKNLFHLSTKEMLSKEYTYKIITRINENITRTLHSQHNLKKDAHVPHRSPESYSTISYVNTFKSIFLYCSPHYPGGYGISTLLVLWILIFFW
jgi:hypothetical protein